MMFLINKCPLSSGLKSKPGKKQQNQAASSLLLLISYLVHSSILKMEDIYFSPKRHTPSELHDVITLKAVPFIF
jgi:hypothetical protein